MLCSTPQIQWLVDRKLSTVLGKVRYTQCPDELDRYVDVLVYSIAHMGGRVAAQWKIDVFIPKRRDP